MVHLTRGGGAQAMTRLMETSFRTLRPTKNDIIRLLISLSSPEERHKILTDARKWFRETAPEDISNPQRWAEPATPGERPDWDCDPEEGRGHLERYRVTILQGLKRGHREAMSIAKPSEVIQRESESPSEFCERLCKACRLYTPRDPARGCWVSDGDKCSLCVPSLP